MWFMGAEEKCVTDMLYTIRPYDMPLQTNMSLGTAWICWAHEYPSVMWGESSTDQIMSWWMNAVVWR